MPSSTSTEANEPTFGQLWHPHEEAARTSTLMAKRMTNGITQSKTNAVEQQRAFSNQRA
jgi:hypothetical protein